MSKELVRQFDYASTVEVYDPGSSYESRVVAVKSMPTLSYGMSGSVQAPPAVNRDPLNLLSLNIGIVAAINTLNARNVASAKIRLYAKRRNGRKFIEGIKTRSLSKTEIKGITKGSESADIVEILEHPALDLLEQGTRHLDGHGMAECIEQYLGALGVCYLRVIKGKNGIPDYLDILPAEYTTLLLDNEGEEVGYRVKSGVYTKDYDINEIIAFKGQAVGGYTRSEGFAPEVGLYGVGFIEQCYEECELLRSISKMARSIANDPRPSTIYSLKDGMGDLDEGQIRLMTRQLEQYMSTRNGKSAFFPSAIDVNPISLAPKELGFEEGKLWLERVVANAAGVPLDILNPHGGGRATSLTSYRSYAIHTLVPKLRRYCDTLTKELLPLYDDDMFFRADNPTPIDEQQILKEEQFEVSSGIISINEARARRDLPALEQDMRSSPDKASRADTSSGSLITGTVMSG